MVRLTKKQKIDKELQRQQQLTEMRSVSPVFAHLPENTDESPETSTAFRPVGLGMPREFEDNPSPSATYGAVAQPGTALNCDDVRGIVKETVGDCKTFFFAIIRYAY